MRKKKNLLVKIGMSVLVSILTIHVLVGTVTASRQEITSGQEYVFYYGNGCTHCAKVEEYFERNAITKKYSIKMIETWYDQTGAMLFAQTLKNLNIQPQEAGVPFLVFSGKKCYYLGDDPIIAYFEALEKQREPQEKPICKEENVSEQSMSGNTLESKKKFREKTRLTFILAVSDSFNPCEFVIVLIILITILTKTGSRLKTLLAGVLFSVGLGSVYYIFGLGIARFTAEYARFFKYIVGGLAIAIGLANLKDVFRYGKGFVMEVPFRRRPYMKKLLSSVTSPAGAFVAGILVSMFLAPCSGGPLVVYSTLMGGLAEGYDYRRFLFLYTFIFILPMLVITALISFGIVEAKAINRRKENNTTLMHAIMAVVMLGLGGYVLLTM